LYNYSSSFLFVHSKPKVKLSRTQEIKLKATSKGAHVNAVFDKYLEQSGQIVGLSEAGTAVAGFLTGAGSLLNQGIEDAIESLNVYKGKLEESI